MEHNASAGSEGLFTGRTANYWNTGKGVLCMLLLSNPPSLPNPRRALPTLSTSRSLIIPSRIAGSTWSGGITMPAFAYWKGQIQPQTRTSEVVSSMDVLPTLSQMAQVPLPTNRVYDGKPFVNVSRTGMLYRQRPVT